MQISVALDGSRHRDLSLFQGDEVTLEVVVYAVDGDEDPIAPTGIRFADTDTGLTYGDPFTVGENMIGRRWYRLVGEVAGATTTLAYGFITVDGEAAPWLWGSPVDGYWVAP